MERCTTRLSVESMRTNEHSSSSPLCREPRGWPIIGENLKHSVRGSATCLVFRRNDIWSSVSRQDFKCIIRSSSRADNYYLGHDLNLRLGKFKPHASLVTVCCQTFGHRDSNVNLFLDTRRWPPVHVMRWWFCLFDFKSSQLSAIVYTVWVLENLRFSWSYFSPLPCDWLSIFDRW